MTILHTLLQHKPVLVRENERALTLYNGEIHSLHKAGLHWLPNRGNRLEVVFFNLDSGIFSSVYEKALFEKLPDVAREHLRIFQTGQQEILLIEREGRIVFTMAPDSKLVLWNDAGPWAERRIDVAQTLIVEQDLIRRLTQARKAELLSVHVIAEGHIGLLSIDGRHDGLLEPGIHGFWNIGKTIQVKSIDLRRQSLEVSGQEMLTRDRVTIRINISADYRIADPLKAISSVKDFSEALYRALQFAFRRAIGAMTLDQILERKITINDEIATKVREDMAAIGIEVADIELKDTILPGEMRDILNKVVAAEKEAEANVIRRREETNATRALLNTAKVMAENPVMLRLKELEALETISARVDQLTIHNGTVGLMNDLIKLRET